MTASPKSCSLDSPLGPPAQRSRESTTTETCKWILPATEGFCVMNFLMQTTACMGEDGEPVEVQLIERYAKAAAAYSSHRKRWQQCFLSGKVVRTNWKGIDFVLQRCTMKDPSCANGSETGIGRMLRPEQVEGLRVIASCTWKQLNALVDAADEFERKCACNGVTQTVVLPSRDGQETVVNNVAPMTALKDVWWPNSAAKRDALTALSALKPKAGYPARFLLRIRGPNHTGKTTLVRALATETGRELYQHTVTGDFSAVEMAELMESTNMADGETILVLRDAQKLRPKVFDVRTAKQILNGILTPLHSIVVFIFEGKGTAPTDVESRLETVFTHSLASEPVSKPEHKEALVAQALRRNGLSVPKMGADVTQEAIRAHPGPIPAGNLVNAVVSSVQQADGWQGRLRDTLSTESDDAQDTHNPLVQ